VPHEAEPVNLRSFGEILRAVDALEIHVPTLFSEELLQRAGVHEADEARHDRASLKYLLHVSGYRQVRARIAERVYVAISTRYPHLADECRRQQQRETHGA
jgi:hypothetical protein